MALAKTIFALAPHIIKARARRPGKRLAGVALSMICLVLAGLFLMAAGFVWLMKTFGAEFGFLAVGAVFLIGSIILYFLSHSPKSKPEDMSAQLGEDPLARHIPEDLRNDPRVLALIEKIEENPMGSTAAAVSLGFIISTQIVGD